MTSYSLTNKQIFYRILIELPNLGEVHPFFFFGGGDNCMLTWFSFLPKENVEDQVQHSSIVYFYEFSISEYQCCLDP